MILNKELCLILRDEEASFCDELFQKTMDSMKSIIIPLSKFR